MIVTVWGLGPLPGAVVVSALPVAAVLVRPAVAARRATGRRPRRAPCCWPRASSRWRCCPRSSSWWAAAALAVCGAGFGLLVPPLTAGSVAGERGLALAGTLSVGARHVGLVLALADGGAGAGRRPRRRRRPGDAQRDPGDPRRPPRPAAEGPGRDRPLRRVRAHPARRGARPRGRAFAANGAADDAECGRCATTWSARSRRPSPGASAPATWSRPLFALLALVPVCAGLARDRAARRAPRPPPRRARPARGAGRGRRRPGRRRARDRRARTSAARPSPTPAPRDRARGGGGSTRPCRASCSTAWRARRASSSSSREDLVLSFGSGVGTREIPWDPPTVERAVRSGLVRAIDDAEDRGLAQRRRRRRAAGDRPQRAPVEELIEGGGAPPRPRRPGRRHRRRPGRADRPGAGRCSPDPRPGAGRRPAGPAARGGCRRRCARRAPACGPRGRRRPSGRRGSW